MPLRNPFRTHPRLSLWTANLMLLAAFLLLFIYLRPIIGQSMMMVIGIPITVCAWFLGFWPGLSIAVFTLAVTTWITLLQLEGNFGNILQSGGLVGYIALLVIAGISGYLGEFTRKNRRIIENTLRKEKERKVYPKFLSLLNDIMRAALEAEDMTSMLDVFAHRTGELFEADACYITRWDEADRAAYPMAAFGPLRERYASILPESDEISLTRSVLENGRAIAVEDVRNSPYIGRKLAKEYPNQSALGLPLIAGDQNYGAVILGFDDHRQFSKDIIERGEMAARQISLAITKQIALEETRQRVKELAGLNQITKTFSIHEDPHRIYGLLTECLAELLGAGMCLIGLQDNETNQIRGQSPAYGLTDTQAEALSYETWLGTQIWDFTLRDVFWANKRSRIPKPFAKIAKAYGVESIMVAPMWDSNKQLFGIIYAANKPGGFNEDDLRLISTFSRQSAIVIINMQLLTRERIQAREHAILYEISTAATEEMDEDELIERVTKIIGDNLYSDNLGILMVDEKNRTLRKHSSYRDVSAEQEINIPLGEGVTGKVASTGETIRLDDVSQAPYYIQVDEKVQSEVCVPLKIGGKVIGVINAESHKLRAFTQLDEDLLIIIAGQLSVAIERWRSLQADIRQRNILLRSNALFKALAEVGARTAIASDIESIIQTLGSELEKLGMLCLLALVGKDKHNISVRYTSIPARVIQIIERASKSKITDHFIDPELFLPYIGEIKSPKLIQDPLFVAKNVLTDFSLQAVKRILSRLGLLGNMPICQLPLIVEGNLLGILWMWGEGLREDDIPAMSIFANQIAIALQNANLLAEVKWMAITDEVTHIYNRHHFFHLAEQEFNRAGRYQQPLSALILDIDQFKLFNDQYGHVIGDQVLRGVAQMIKANLRQVDILGRYGGEEFSILLPVTDIDAAFQIAERLQAHVGTTKVDTDGGPLGIKISVGVACMSEETETLLSLIDRADQAMYAAKRMGGNRVARF